MSINNNSKISKAEIKQAFSSNIPVEYKVQYMSNSYDNIKENVNSIFSLSKIIVLFMIVFELLTRASISEVDISGFKLTDLSLIQKILPFVISYIGYLLVINYVYTAACIRVYIIFLEETFPDYRNPSKIDLLNFTIPSDPLFKVGSIVSLWENNFLIDSIRNLTGIQAIIIMTMPAVFYFYAMYRIFTLFGLYDIVNIVVLILSSYFVAKFYGILCVFLFSSFFSYGDN